MSASEASPLCGEASTSSSLSGESRKSPVLSFQESTDSESKGRELDMAELAQHGGMRK